MKASFVYIMTNRKHGTLYVGVTSELPQRVWLHKSKQVDGFTKRYGLDKLVWYEIHTDIRAAIKREKQIKKWNRAWKIRLIETLNPRWDDLYGTFTGEGWN